MKRNWFHILAALADADLHGSGIVRRVLDHTDGAVRLWPATLYGSLEALSDAGLVRELAESELPDDVSAQRRYYGLTRDGRQALRDEATRMSSLATAVLDRLERA